MQPLVSQAHGDGPVFRRHQADVTEHNHEHLHQESQANHDVVKASLSRRRHIWSFLLVPHPIMATDDLGPLDRRMCLNLTEFR